jgi:ubiquinone biosynthesis protein
MLRALRNSWRLLRMASSFARHDALFPLETLGIAPALIAWARLFARRRDPRRPGERLAAALQDMGPSFIKLGQALSTRADLLNEGVAADLGRLQDHLHAVWLVEVSGRHRLRCKFHCAESDFILRQGGEQQESALC